MHYYKFNIGDWHLHTSHLTLIEEAVYFRLVNHYYNTEKPFKKSETQTLIRRLRLGSEIETVELILGEFFSLNGENYIHTRCEKEIKSFKKKSKVNKANGSKGGRPPAPKGVEEIPEETQTVSEINPDITLTTNQEPLTIKHKPVTSNQLKDISTNVDDVFDYWCSVMQKNITTKLTAKRKKVITDRIKDGYSVDEIKSAIDNCSRSPFHMGQNDSRTKYNDIDLICRAEKFEQFRDNVGQQQKAQIGLSTGNTINNIRDLEFN